MRRLGHAAAALAGLAPLAGCATAWDNLTSRTYRADLWKNPYQTLFVTPDPLVTLRDNPNGAARAKALKRLEEPKRKGKSDAEQDEVLAILATAARSERQPLLRLAAIQKLGTWQDPRAARALVDAYESLAPAAAAAAEDPASGLMTKRFVKPDRVAFMPDTINTIQCATLAALGESGQPDAVAFLGRVARKPLPAGGDDAAKDIKLAAVRALGKTKDAGSAPALVEVLREASEGSSRDVALRDRTVEALRRVTGKDLPADPAAWQQAVGTAPAGGGDSGVVPAGGTRP